LKFGHLDEVVRSVAGWMGNFTAPWCVAGGWALDVFLGEVTRPHDDLEIALFRQDQSRLWQHFSGWRFDKIVGGRRELWRGEELSLPVHEIHGHAADGAGCAMEFLLNERDGDRWIFRRNASVSLPVERAFLQSTSGLPVLAPEIVLLFKSKSPRPKDESDFTAARGRLGETRRQWLRAALCECYQRHPWIEMLTAESEASSSAVAGRDC
jgi:hypothetical protein